MKNEVRIATLCLFAGLLAYPGALWAATHDVSIAGFAFSPKNITINSGDTVVWTEEDGAFHTTTSDTGVWDSGTLELNQSFSFTFTTPGQYPYHCKPHPGMKGTVIVQTAGNAAPSVTITAPANGASMPAPAEIAVQATAEDADGNVTNVAFFDGTILLGQVNVVPYNLMVSLAPGNHSLTAVATDNLGATATSSVVAVTVTGGNIPPSITITNPINDTKLGSSLVTLRASAEDSDGSVTNVQFFDSETLLGSDATAPYSLAARVSLGMHMFTAVAMDDLGAMSTSAPVHVVLERYLPEITNGPIALFLEPIATAMGAPDYAISPPGDDDRLFVVEQNGLLRVIQDGVLLPGAALDIRNRVSPPLNTANPNDERGFLGLAFHPGFNNPNSPGYRTLYTYNSEMIPTGTAPTYPVPTTATNNYKNVVNEWKTSNTDPNVVDPTSRREVVSFGKTAGNHNGGTIAFGPDGYLYLGLGDGGDANDVGVSHIEPGGNAQNLSTPLGKMLRIDPLDPSLTANSADPVSGNGQYRIPASNPFKGEAELREIFASGLRNPYRFSFDRENGELIVADVGQNNIEEINRLVPGGNFGWPIKEGEFLFNRTNGPSGNAGTIGAPPGNHSPGVPAGLIDPIRGTEGTLQYDHNDGISITGGFVYRGSSFPALYGKYIFGDLALRTAPVRADGRIFYADLQTGLIHAFPLPQFGGSAILPNGLTVHGFGEDREGELYALVTNTSSEGTGGIVYRLTAGPRLATQVTGNSLEISWSTPGARLESQTNSPGTGLSGTWSPIVGSESTNRVVVPVEANSGSVFYRLSVP